MTRKGHKAARLPQWDREMLRVQLKRLSLASSDVTEDEGLQPIILNAADPGTDLAWLAAYDLDPTVSRGSFAALLYAIESGTVAPRLRQTVMDHTALVLLKALQSPAIPDARKYAIGGLYGLCAGKLPENYPAFFKDFDAAAKNVLNEMTANLTEDPECVSAVMTETGMIDHGETPAGPQFNGIMEMAAHIIEQKPAAAAALISANIVVGLSDNTPGAFLDEALRTMERARCPETVWFLEELARWPGTGEFREKAKRAAAKLKLTGLAPAYTLRPVFSHALVTPPDGTGSRHLGLFYLTSNGGMDAALLLLNDRVGVKDAMCFFQDGAHIEDRIRQDLRALRVSICSLAQARELMADMWAMHEELETAFPPLMFVYRPFLGPEPIMPKRRTPDLSVYCLDTRPRTPDLIEESEFLMDEESYGAFAFTSDRAYECIRALGPKKRWQCLPKAKFDVFLRDVAGHEREILLARMAAVLEVEVWGGRAVSDINQIAANTYLCLRENLVPFTDVPYIRLLAEEGAEAILRNLALGYSSQAEANEAALRFDAAQREQDYPEDDEGYWE